jgi:hypothetical protein
MKVELLYFEGCPSYERLRPRLEALVNEHAPGAELDLRLIDSERQAEQESFLGSPTVRVDGRDVDPSAAGRRDFGLKCRLYRTGDHQSSTPPEQWVAAALARD